MEESTPINLTELFEGYCAIEEQGERKWFLDSSLGVLDHDLTVKEALELAENVEKSEDHWWFAFHLCAAVKTIPAEMAQWLLTESLKVSDPGRLKECLTPVLKCIGFYKMQAMLLNLFPKLNEIEKSRAITSFYWGRPSDLVDSNNQAGYYNWWEDKEITRKDEVKKIDDSLSGIQNLVFIRLLKEAEITTNDSIKMKILQLLPRERDYYRSEEWDIYASVFLK